MSLAETATLLADLQMTENISGQAHKALNSVKGLETGLKSAGAGADVTATKMVGGLGKIHAGVTKLGGALSHAGSQISGLIQGPLGLLGLAGGLGAIDTFFEDSIEKATKFGEAVAKVAAITGQTAMKSAGLVDAFQKMDVPLEKVPSLVGKMASALGKLDLAGLQVTDPKMLARLKAHGTLFDNMNRPLDKLTTLLKNYKLNLLDAHGQILSTNDALVRMSDYFTNKHIPSFTKAAALNAVFGKSWKDLIPLLSLGGARLKALLAQGPPINEQDIKNMEEFKAAQRDWDKTLNDLQITIGAKLLPKVTSFIGELNSFVSGHADDLVRFFGQAADNAAGFAQQAYAVGKALVTAWETIPKPLRDLIVAGTIGSKVVSFLFGFNPMKIAVDFAEGAISKLAGSLAGSVATSIVGSLPSKEIPQNVFVVNWAMMGGGGLGADAAGAAGGEAGAIERDATTFGSKLARVLELASKVFIVGLVADFASQAAPTINQMGADLHDAIFGKGTGVLGTGFQINLNDMQWPFGPKNTPKILPEIFGGNGLLGGTSGPGVVPGDPSTGWVPPPGWKMPGGMGKTQGDVESGRGSRFGPHPTRPHTPTDMVLAARAVKQGVGPDMEKLRGTVSTGLHSNAHVVGQDIERLRGTIAAGLRPKPTGGGDRGKGSQGDMEGRRGSIGDALARAGAREQKHQSALLAQIDKHTFRPDVKLDPSQIIDLRKPMQQVGTDVEAMRGRIAQGLSGVKTAVDRKKLSSSTKVQVGVKNLASIVVSAAAVTHAQYKTAINQSASYMNTYGNLTGDSSPMAGK